MTTATTSYLICSTPRSGTTLLCEALRNTGLAGRPEEYFQQLVATGRPRGAHDYFDGVDDPQLLELLECCRRVEHDMGPLRPHGFQSYADYFRWALERGTTPNGVFGAKLMWAYLGGLVTGLRETPALRRIADPAELLATAFPNLHYVFACRADKVRQAVSLWRALQTWTWCSKQERNGRHGEEPVQPSYSFEAIDHLARRLEEEEAAWRDYFDRHGLEPYTVVYEELADAYEQTATAILRYMGIRIPVALRFGQREIIRQADELSEEWVQRYASEAMARV